MSNEAWQTALVTFRGAYGGEPDFNDETDRNLFLDLLTKDVTARVKGRLSAAISAGATRIRNAGAAR